MADPTRVEPLGVVASGLLLPVALLAPREADLVALGITCRPLPSLLLLARSRGAAPPPHVALARVGDAPAIVLTWIDPAPDLLSAGVSQAWGWAVHGPGPYRVLLRCVPPGHDPALAPAAEGAPRPVARPLSIAAPPAAPGVTIDPTAVALGPETAFSRYKAAPPAGVAESSALLFARPTATGRRLGAAVAAPLADGVRVRLALPLDPGLPLWGPRPAGEVEVLVVERRPGERCEWLLELA